MDLKCGTLHGALRIQLEKVEHVLKECPLHPAERDLLRKVSLELDSKILVDIKKGLGAVVKFLDPLPQLL